MKKRIAVLVTDRQHEALRMAVGLAIGDDEVNVFIMDSKLESDEANAMNIEALRDMNVRIFSNNPENEFEEMTTEQIAKTLINYDVVIPY